MFRLSAALCFGSILLSAQQPNNDGLKAPFRESTATAPNNSIARPILTSEQRGDIFMARKMYREALDAYREGANSSAILANKAGIAYHQLSAMPLAKKQYEMAQRLDPQYAEAINNLGTIYYAMKNYRRAITQYKRALTLNPLSASILSNLGTAFFARKKYPEAFEAYQQALKLDPEVFEHRGANGVLLQERNVSEKAKFHFYMAKTYAKTGNTERALIYMRKAIEEGFKERNKFLEDAEFAGLQKIPEFQELMKLEARAL